jgi:hypothetical protein
MSANFSFRFTTIEYPHFRVRRLATLRILLLPMQAAGAPAKESSLMPLMKVVIQGSVL